MTRLVIKSGPQSGESIELNRSVSIGRGKNADVRLADNTLSRRHALVEVINGIWQIRDLDSSNGTFVNDVMVQDATLLRDGDAVRLGSLVLEYHAEPQSADAALAGITLEAGGEATTIIASVPVDDPIAPILPEGIEAEAGRLVLKRLQLLSEVAEFLGKVIEGDKLFPEILEKLLAAFPDAERGCIVLCSPDGSNLDPAATLVRPGAKSQISVSQTLANEVIAKREAVLSADISGDDRFDSEHTLVRYGLRTVMCAPMICEDMVLGLMQLDSSHPHSKFSKADLALLLGIAGHTALALGKAKLHEKLLAQQLLQKDLELAERIQHCFLPKTSPPVPGFRFAQSYTAAQHIGGDYYDFVEISDTAFGIAVGDVSGKGVSAALYMAKLSSEMRFHARGRLSPGAILTALNRGISAEMEGGMFVTLILLIVEPEEHKVSISSAGHFPPLLRSADKSVSELEVENNFPVGIVSDNAYADREFVLKRGDQIILYTDGVTESMNKEGDFFGKDRLIEAVARGGDSPKELLSIINQAVSGHSKGLPQNDDLTIVCLAVD
ncbi:MAG: SpoIIE family protein phosphatase [Desulfobacterales bacterium]|nr:SpoIIE family protein phosphatase [Desulfobacterales bacterium]